MFGKLRVGIIGAGRIAVIMTETIKKMKQVVPYAISSRSLEKAQSFAYEYGFSQAYGSYEEMLKDKKVDLVYIATPHSTHLEYAKLCIDYGKPVLCEKPFCVNAKEAQELLDYAKEKNVFITEAMWIRYLPLYAAIKELLDSGIIGKPQMLTANLGYSIMNKERMIDPALAGGALLDVGIYPINFACMFLGDDIESISADAVFMQNDNGKMIPLPEMSVEKRRKRNIVDTQNSITIRYKNGAMAVLNSSMNSVSDRMGAIHGTKGYMVIENINNFQSVTVYDSTYKKVEFKKCPKQITGYEYEVLCCKKALKNKKLFCEEMPHETTLKMMRILDKVREEIGLVYPMERADFNEPGNVPMQIEDTSSNADAGKYVDTCEKVDGTESIDTAETVDDMNKKTVNDAANDSNLINNANKNINENEIPDINEIPGEDELSDQLDIPDEE